MNKMDNFLKTLCFTFLATFLATIDAASAQFEDFPLSVAMDNTEYQFSGFGWEAKSEAFTKGGSSAQSFSTGSSSSSSLTGFVAGDKTITFDYRYRSNTGLLINTQVSFIAYTASGQTPINRVIASNTTDGFQTVSFYLPSSVEQVQWLDFSGGPGITAWIDNVRIVDGDQTTDSGSGLPSPFQSNALSAALDNTQFDFSTGTPGFFAQSNIFNVGGDSVQSSNISNNQKTEMTVEVNGPVNVSFDWKVSSEAGKDFLRVTVYDNNFEPTTITKLITGEQDWATTQLSIPPGIYFLVWDYSKNSSVSSGADAGWVDRVIIGGVSDEVSENDKSKVKALAPIINLILN